MVQLHRRTHAGTQRSLGDAGLGNQAEVTSGCSLCAALRTDDGAHRMQADGLRRGHASSRGLIGRPLEGWARLSLAHLGERCTGRSEPRGESRQRSEVGRGSPGRPAGNPAVSALRAARP